MRHSDRYTASNGIWPPYAIGFQPRHIRSEVAFGRHANWPNPATSVIGGIRIRARMPDCSLICGQSGNRMIPYGPFDFPSRGSDFVCLSENTTRLNLVEH